MKRLGKTIIKEYGINIKNTFGISIDYDSHSTPDLILKERLESNMEWFPEEMLLKSFSKSAIIFLTKYNFSLFY